jgi:hypothetical protein
MTFDGNMLSSYLYKDLDDKSGPKPHNPGPVTMNLFDKRDSEVLVSPAQVKADEIINMLHEKYPNRFANDAERESAVQLVKGLLERG